MYDDTNLREIVIGYEISKYFPFISQQKISISCHHSFMCILNVYVLYTIFDDIRSLLDTFNITVLWS